MPMYDLICPECDFKCIDVLQPIECDQPYCENCRRCDTRYVRMERAWLTAPPSVIGDECDVWVRHGICNEDGSPRRYRSKAEMARVAKSKGLANDVRHVGSEGGDRSPHTSRWV